MLSAASVVDGYGLISVDRWAGENSDLSLARTIGGSVVLAQQTSSVGMVSTRSTGIATRFWLVVLAILVMCDLAWLVGLDGAAVGFASAWTLAPVADLG